MRHAVVVAVVLLAAARPAGAWGPKGHAMTARVATRALPKDMPAFFRKADIELGWLCPEPDRWRSADREPALRGHWDRDHVVKLELLTEPLPPHRYDFFLAFTKKEKPGGGNYGWREMGFAPYAMAEHLEMLTVNFMIWRKLEARTPEERRIKRQVEQNIIHIAGLLSHFVTDTGNPMHTTVHTNGWVDGYPNPNGFVGKGLHGRFEHEYVGKAIEEKDFQSLLAPARERSGPWLEEAMAHIRESFGFVEQVYTLDKASAFASGNETPEHKRFTCERLAFSAQALRDFWHSAWLRSATIPEHNSLTQYVPITPPRATRAAAAATKSR
jgi:hypothetical protein